MTHRNESGITLFETVAAIGIILSVMVGAFALIIAGSAQSSVIKNRLIASNLAQEAIEIVRSFRDGNVISGCKRADGTPDWRGKVDTSPLCLSIDIDDNSSGMFYEVDKKSTAFSSAVVTPRKLKFCPTPPTSTYADYGFYVYSCAGGDPFAYDTFARQVVISTPADESICVTTCGVGEDDPVIIPSRDRLLVTVTVSWQEKGFNPSIIQSEIMYNWK